MPVLVILIIFSLAFYIFYKTKYFVPNYLQKKVGFQAKSSISLGSFVGLFGINQLFLFQSTVTYIVAAFLLF